MSKHKKTFQYKHIQYEIYIPQIQLTLESFCFFVTSKIGGIPPQK